MLDVTKCMWIWTSRRLPSKMVKKKKKGNIRTKSTEQKEAEYKEKEILAVLEAKKKSLNGQEMKTDSRRKWLC